MFSKQKGHSSVERPHALLWRSGRVKFDVHYLYTTAGDTSRYCRGHVSWFVSTTVRQVNRYDDSRTSGTLFG